MAGGYICRKFEWDCGRTDTPAERTAFVLKGCAQALLDTNTGWALDTAKNATLDDYTQASGDANQGGGTASACYMLFFKSTSGAKLCLGYRYGYGATNTYRAAIANSQCAGGIAVLGLFASIIEPGLGDEFSTASPYRSTNATLFTGPCHCSIPTYSQSGTFSCQSFACTNTANITYQYFIITNGTNVILLNHSNQTNTNAPNYGCTILGRLYTTLFNSDFGDSLHGGVFQVSKAGNNTDSYYTYEYAIQSYGINLETYYVTAPNSKYDDLFYRLSAFQLSDGSWQTGLFTDSTSTNYYGVNASASSTQLNSTIGTGRWVPIYAYGTASTSDIANHYVANGNTLKGYIDPDLARLVNTGSRYARGTTFDNGNLIYLGGGLAVGWDPSNTVAIF